MGASIGGKDRLECDRACRTVAFGFGDCLTKVCEVGDGVDWPVRASGAGKTMVEGVLRPLDVGDSKVKASPSLFLVLPPQFRRML